MNAPVKPLEVIPSTYCHNINPYLCESGCSFTKIPCKTNSWEKRILEKNLPPAACVMSSLVQFNGLRIMVLFPFNSTVDKNQVKKHCSFLSKMGRSSIQLPDWFTCTYYRHLLPFPAFFNMPCIIDSRLLEAQQLYLASGSDDYFFSMSADEYIKLIDSPIIENIATPFLFPLELTPFVPFTETSCQKSVFIQKHISQHFEDANHFPPLSKTSEKLIALRDNPNADVEDLTMIIEADPSLSAQVISWASSPYYGMGGKIYSVQDAILNTLGYDTVLNLSLGLSLSKGLDVPLHGPLGLHAFWLQALNTAKTARYIAKAIPKSKHIDPHLAYLCGLMHNFGLLVLAQLCKEYFNSLNEAVSLNPHVDIRYLEREYFALDHTAIGAYVMDLWDLPTEVMEVTLYHHDLCDDTKKPYLQLIQTASAITNCLPAPNAEHKLLSDAHITSFLDQFHISRSEFMAIVKQIHSTQEEIEQLTHVMLFTRDK